MGDIPKSDIPSLVRTFIVFNKTRFIIKSARLFFRWFVQAGLFQLSRIMPSLKIVFYDPATCSKITRDGFI